MQIRLIFDRKKAFREAFELFDKNGGGTIDASELQRTLADVGIHIDSAGLLEVFINIFYLYEI